MQTESQGGLPITERSRVLLSKMRPYPFFAVEKKKKRMGGSQDEDGEWHADEEGAEEGEMVTRAKNKEDAKKLIEGHALFDEVHDLLFCMFAYILLCRGWRSAWWRV